MIKYNIEQEEGLSIDRPTLIIYKSRVLRNIKKILKIAESSSLLLRPHFKTHQSIEIGKLFRHYGIDKITVSSVEMAELFIEHGWKDVTIAFLLNPVNIKRINTLSVKAKISVLVDSLDVIQQLIQKNEKPLDVWIKIDTGLGRTGIPYNKKPEITELATLISESKSLNFKGILTHAGQSYKARNRDDIRIIFNETKTKMRGVQSYLLKHSINSCLISIGDTPTCSFQHDFSGIDEIRPGNFVYYDVMQYYIGSCTKEEIAVAVACPVVGKYNDRQQIVIHGGAVHLSRESLIVNNERVYGFLADQNNHFIESAPVISLSQEHGIIRLDDALFSEIEIGDAVLVSPIHSCLTSNLLQNYLIMNSENN